MGKEWLSGIRQDKLAVVTNNPQTSLALPSGRPIRCSRWWDVLHQ